MRHVLNERILKLNLILGEQIHISDFTMELLKVQIKFKKKTQKRRYLIECPRHVSEEKKLHQVTLKVKRFERLIT